MVIVCDQMKLKWVFLEIIEQLFHASQPYYSVKKKKKIDELQNPN